MSKLITMQLAVIDRDDPPIIYREVVISLLFKESITAAHHLERTLPFPEISPTFRQQFARFLKVFRLRDDTRNGRTQLDFLLEKFPFGEIRWLVADLEDEEHHQVVVKQLTLEVGGNARHEIPSKTMSEQHYIGCGTAQREDGQWSSVDVAILTAY
jgi:hypothetical protein